MLWKESPKRYPYSPIQSKKIPLSQICSDLSLTPKKGPFSKNFRTHMLTHIVKVLPPRAIGKGCYKTAISIYILLLL